MSKSMAASFVILAACICGCDESPTTTTPTTPSDTSTAPRPDSRTPSSTGTPSPTSPAPSTTPPVTPPAGGDADRDITMAIQSAMRNQALSPQAMAISITTADGVVTLRGTVASDKERETLENVARGVSGVNSVVNELEVSPR